MTFGIVRCGVCRTAESAAPVMPEMFAIASKRGAAGFGESGCVLSVA